MKSAPCIFRRLCVFVFVGCLHSIHSIAGESWPDFRGPAGDGHSGSKGTPLHWGEGKNVTWKTKIPLLGLSSPIVMGGQVWLTTADVPGHDYYVLCVDATTGKIITNNNLFHVEKPQSMGNWSRDNS